MKFEPTPLSGSYVVHLEPRTDERGQFSRTFCKREFLEQGIAFDIVQANESRSAKSATLRGLHYQLPPHAEVKLFRCLRGALFDVMVDLRKGSPTFGEWFGTRLIEGDGCMVLVPAGFAHGFLTLENDAVAEYLVSSPYAPQFERGLRWNDPHLAIEWPCIPVVVSERDERHPPFGSDSAIALPCYDD